MIDFRQIRAARALLNWSQADLARAADMATSSIKNIESESSTARKDTVEQITAAFDQNGVEFLPGSGVRLKNDIVAVHDGKRATTALLDDIYAHVQSSRTREVCIIGLDETFSVETDGLLPIARHVDCLTQAGIGERILVSEGDTRFINAARALPTDVPAAALLGALDREVSDEEVLELLISLADVLHTYVGLTGDEK